MMKRMLMIAAAVCAIAAAAEAWHEAGHVKLTESALKLVEGQMPEFFSAGGEAVCAAVGAPDMFTRPVASPGLHSTESPEHFFDMEPVAGVELPATRQEFLDLLAAKKLKVGQVGLLPYEIAECTQKLAIALAEHRNRPADKGIQAKCLVYAGLLAHYAQDACQPLHTTIHYDGRAGDDGKSPRSGIHNKVDALAGKLKADLPALLKDVEAKPLFDAEKAPVSKAGIEWDTPLVTAIASQLKKSHELVDSVYDQEKDLPAMDAAIPAAGKAEEFARDRYTESARFTACLYLTAWKMSDRIVIPAWSRGASQPTSAPTQPASAPSN